MEYRKFYTIDMVSGFGRIAKQFETYREAYDYMCRNYVRELNEGYKPTFYKIMEHDVSSYNGSTNIMVKPTWN